MGSGRVADRHMDPALKGSSGWEEDGEGGQPTQYCPVPSVPEFAGSSVTAAFSTDEQAVHLQLLLVLNAAWRGAVAQPVKGLHPLSPVPSCF